MFARKFVVIALPLLMLTALCLLSPILDSLDYVFSSLIRGGLLGICLALMLPLTGVVRHKPPFAVLLWLPTVLLSAVIVCQVLATRNVRFPMVELITTADGQVFQLEAAFAGFMGVSCFRIHG